MKKRLGLLPPAVLPALLLAGCAGWLTPPARPGDTLDEVRARMGRPSEEFPSPDGSRRLEYTTAPMGRITWMLDFDATGRLQRWENVLDPAHFARIEPGITRDELRRRLGTPAKVWKVRYHDQTVWSWRYEAERCMLFHVGITPQGLVEDTSYGPDEACERRMPQW